MNIENREEWELNIKSYISATKLFNYFLDDPLLDYLNKYGLEMGFKEQECPEDVSILMNKGHSFEKRVIEEISKIIPVIEVKNNDSSNNNSDNKNKWVNGSIETFHLMKQGHPIISQGFLVNHLNKTKGRPDILIRSDYINKLKPDLLDLETVNIPSRFGNWHYCVIDIKMSNLLLTSNGKYITNNKIYKAYKAQLLVYNTALSHLQDYFPSQSYLLGRSSHNYDNSLYENNCLSSISSVDFKENVKDNEFITKLEKAIEWHNILKTLPIVSRNDNLMDTSDDNLNNNLMDTSNDSNNNLNLNLKIKIKWNWEEIEVLLPEYFQFNLRPNMKNKYDYKWKDAKKEIARDREELTLLWNCGIAKRNKALLMGITDFKGYMNYCKKNKGYQNTVLGCILEINSPDVDNLILPDAIDEDYLDYIPPRDRPFIVLDFETTNNLNDEFENLPEKGGNDFTFLIGLTIAIPINKNQNQNQNQNQKQNDEKYNLEYEYRYFPFMINQLNHDDELIILKNMLNVLIDFKKYMCSSDDLEENKNLNENFHFNNSLILNHWSQAEPIFFEKMCERQFEFLDEKYHKIIDDIQFNDILTLFKNQPITIKGAFDFGLKSIANAMYNNGMIKTIWENDLNGFSVMIKINEYNKEAENLDLNLKDFQEVKDIIIYNMVDCQVLAEIIVFLQETF